MFLQAKVVCIVGNNYGNASNIDSLLVNAGIKNRFFNQNPSIYKNRSYKNFLEKLPPETVFAITKTNPNTNSTNRFKIAIPFVSSHLGLPIKEGETIWLQEIISTNDIQQKFNITGYYLGRAHSYITTEDASYCYDDREKNIFNVDRPSYADNLYSQKQNAKNKSEMKKKVSEDSAYIYTHTINFDNDATRFVAKPNEYFPEKIRNYKLNSTSKIFKKPEDTLLRGSYNNIINLTSIDDPSTKKRCGSINLIAGYGEYSKSETVDFDVNQKTLDNKNLNRKIEIRKYETDVAGATVHNGIFYETIKSDKAFYNEGSFEGLRLNTFSKNMLNDNTTFSINAASLSISETNLKSADIQSKNIMSLSDFDIYTKFSYSRSNTLDSDRIITHPMPLIKKNNSFEENTSGGSEIVGVADSIVFNTHSNAWSRNNTIKLIQTNSVDNLSSQIAINDTGNILLDGNNIIIGSKNRSDNRATVFICPSEVSQSLVLGEQLKEFLHEMLTVQLDVYREIFSLMKQLNSSDVLLRDDIKALTETIKNWSTAAAPALPGPLAPVGIQLSNLSLQLAKNIVDLQKSVESDTNLVADYITENLKISEDDANYYSSPSTIDFTYYQRLEAIINNLDTMLSKFAKTS